MVGDYVSGMGKLIDVIGTAPVEVGIYVFVRNRRKVVYVGKADSVKQRLAGQLLRATHPELAFVWIATV